MIAAKIIIETQDGCQYSYVNKYLTAKSGNDGEGHTLFAGIPEDLYYYTGAGTDTYANQTGLGKAKGDYDHIKEKADSRTGLIGFPEADSTHADTYELIRTHDFKDAISNDRGSINAADVKMVKLVEREVEYPFPYLRDNETRTNQTYNNDAGIPRTEHYTDNSLCPVQTTVSGTTVTITNSSDYDTIYYRKNNIFDFVALSGTTLAIEKYVELFGEKNGIKSGISVFYVK